MKKRLWMLVILLMTLCACGEKEPKTLDIEPEISQMKSICELATMDCYYHNVAKYKKEDAEGMWWWKKDKHFWIEYAGVVTVGIDISLVEIEVEEEKVTITMPEAKVLGCKVDEKTLTKESFIVAKNSADVTAEDQTYAFKEAQASMENAAASDKALLANAQQRAQKLLEDYVNNIGGLVDKNYKIKWIFVDENGNKTEQQESQTVESETVTESE